MAWLGRFDDFNSINVKPSDTAKYSKMKIAKSMPPRINSVQPATTSTASKALMNSFSCSDNSGYSRISDITTKMNSVSLIGVIISKEAPKSIISRKGQGAERHLLAFTVCDAPLCFINVTCWGRSEFISFLASEINIGDVVDIKGAHVQAKSNNSSDEKFKPWTPSPCQLNISDYQGTVAPYTGLDASEYSSLVHAPTRANNDYYTIEDIQANGMSLQGEHINILAVVRKVWPVRDIITKFAKKTKKVDVVLCDETAASFNMTLWDHFVHMAESWVPCETVIFAADVKISFSDFHSSMVASTSCKTILTVDPDIPEAQSLQQFVINQSLYMSADGSVCADSRDPDIESITNVLTVRNAKTLQKDVACNTGQPGYAVVYAFLSHFDIDGDLKMVLKDVCSRCRRQVYESSAYICSNSDCVGGDPILDDHNDVEYSITVSLSDHTGSLRFCHLLPSVAEQLLGCKAKDFKNLAEVEKTQIKWNYLLERMKAVLKMKRVEGRADNRCYVRVLSMEKASPAQLMEQAFTKT